MVPRAPHQPVWARGIYHIVLSAAQSDKTLSGLQLGLQKQASALEWHHGPVLQFKNLNQVHHPDLFLKSGHAISGEFHVPEDTSSSIRPSDALKGVNDGLRGTGNFISLCNVTVRDQEGQERQVEFVQIARDAIAWVEFPPNFHWQNNK